MKRQKVSGYIRKQFNLLLYELKCTKQDTFELSLYAGDNKKNLKEMMKSKGRLNKEGSHACIIAKSSEAKVLRDRPGSIGKKNLTLINTYAL